MNLEQVFGEELRKIREEHNACLLRSGRYYFGGGTYCDLRSTSERSLAVDRVFVPERLRGKGRHKQILSALVQFSDEVGIELSIAVAPDRLGGESADSPLYNKLIDLLVSSAEQLGFQPYRDGEDVYRLDQIYTPKNLKRLEK